MNPEIKQKWLTDLRSGEYEQGQGCLLSTTGKYCCLGVLCKTIDKGFFAPGVTQPSMNKAGVHGVLYNYKDYPTFGSLPPELRREVGITDTQMYELARMNDNGHSFEQIADHIERNF